MYNAAEYIGECLDSILGQTFQDFEVIVVDDCSTDNSVVAVESYIPKFNGRLRLARTEVNSGGGGYVPRNVGFKLAGGEYVYFVDADDFILLTALEILYNAAKEYNADVVYTSARYHLNQPNNIRISRDKEGLALVKSGLEDKITLRIGEEKENIRRLFFEGNYHAGWTKFVRRYFLLENQIVFPEIIRGGDYIWGIHVYCCANRFLRLPIPLYFYRDYGNKSVTKEKKTPSEQIALWVSAFAVWAKTFTEISSKNKALKNNPTYCYAALEQEFMWFFRHILEDIRGFCITDIYKILCNELAKKKDLFDSTVPFLLSVIVAYKKFFLEAKPYISAIEDDTEVKSSPKVSVIISLYNYGKYVGECLESLLAQSFQDFEVIVVDDCSTDNSVFVVESYLSKFNGRLKFTRTKKNTGGGGGPRNIGFSLSSGKYIFFMDADDVVTETALEEMYSSAEKFDADVVYCEKYYMSEGVGQKFIDNIHLADSKIQKPPFVNKPTLETQDMDARIQRALNLNYWVTPWLRLVRRDLLIENDIVFPTFTQSEDVIWVFKVLFCSKNFLRIPNACYIRRMHNESVSTRELSPSEYLKKWMDRTILSLKDMDNFMKRIEFFRENPKIRYCVLNQFIHSDFKKLEIVSKDLKPFEVATIFRQKFGDYLGAQDVLVSCLCAELNAKLQEEQFKNQMVTRFENYITARIDLKLITSGKGDFQILSTSDDKASIKNPQFLNKNGIGYMIQSYAGQLNLTAKATVDGQIQLSLRGEDVRSPENKSKRIPYWLDYTKLIVNDEMIFDTITPAWHDKPYTYKIDVKANQEINVKVEWLPHRSDNVDVTSLTPKVKTPPPPKVKTLPPPKVKTPPPPKVVTLPPQPKVKTPPPLQFETARIDVKLLTRTNGDFQIISVSDDKANITKPRVLQDNGIGYILTSSAGNLMFVAKTTADGQINLKLRGLDVRDKKINRNAFQNG